MKRLILISGVLLGILFSGSSDAQERRYVLGAGDEIRITVFGEKDLSGEFEVSGHGIISMPLVGEITAGGKTMKGLERGIAEKLKDGYLKHPRVSVEVLNYRPFYIIGEVKSPGSYAYVSSMTVLNAVALAKGFTYRADKKDIKIKRTKETKEYKARLDEAVLPGDIIRVTERFF